MAESGVLQAAREAFKRGWVVIPLRENDKRPNLPIGHPYLTERPTAEDYKGFKFGNYGVVCGKMSDIVCLDVDGEEGVYALSVEDVYPDDWITPKVKTPRGTHYYFKYSSLVQTGAAILGPGSGVDIRSDGSYVVGPGSSVDGQAYAWVEGFSPEDVDYMEPPAFMREHRKRFQGNADHDPLLLSSPIANGTRNTTLISVGGTLVRNKNIPPDVLHGCLQYLNDNYMETPLPDSEVRQIAINSEKYRRYE